MKDPRATKVSVEQRRRKIVAKKAERDLDGQKRMDQEMLKGRDEDGENKQPMEQTYTAVFSPLGVIHDPAWPVGGRMPVGLSAGRAPSMYARSPVVDYPSPALSNDSLSYAHPQPFMNEFPRLEPSIGPTRSHDMSTRRQTFSQRVLGRPSSLPRPNASGSLRMLTGNNNDQPTPLRHARPSLSIPPPAYDPMTPSSTPSPYARPFDSSRALPPDSPRVPSPALSADSSASAPDTPPAEVISKPRGKKRHLEDHDRKAICLYHQEHPQERQEDIGKEFDVERSTISKILKQKAKWLNIPDTPGVRVSKHRRVQRVGTSFTDLIVHDRPSKFPEVEEELRKWVEECTARKLAISDNSIRERAKEVAKGLGIPPEKFKASSGWVENFKSRANIRGGIWHGYKKTSARIIDIDISSPDAAASTSASTSPVPGSLSPMNSVFITDRAALESMSPQRETDMDLGASPMEDRQHAAPTPASEHHVSPAVSTAVPWSGADITPSQPSPLSAHSHLEPVSYPHLQQYHLVTPDTTTTNSQPDAGQFIPPERYGPRRIPTAAEAEEYADALIDFIDRQREDFINQEVRDALHTIKLALFKESHGLI
ncbi:hypothetical protein C0995_003216 [Termitomyces sp. Mi166|nr:hypothetical protein C0995_003216 [Termitomyces sp. Mi166\